MSSSVLDGMKVIRHQEYMDVTILIRLHGYRDCKGVDTEDVPSFVMSVVNRCAS